MEYSIQELVGNTSVNYVNPMIPILIGETKTLYKEPLTFLDDIKTQLQLSNIDNSLIDETTLSVTLKSWNIKGGPIPLEFVLDAENGIVLDLTLTERLPNSSIFVLVDNDFSILYSSTIKEFIYQGSILHRIILDNPTALTIIRNGYIINLETKTITGVFNSYSNILTINTDFMFKTPSFTSIYNTSFLKYVGSSRSYSVTYIDKITQNIIDAEQNYNIKAGMTLDKAAVIVSYPNDTYLTQLLEDLEKLTVGYYIVPIGLSYNTINVLISFIKESENNSKFYQIILSNTYNYQMNSLNVLVPTIDPKTIIDSIYTVPSIPIAFDAEIGIWNFDVFTPTTIGTTDGPSDPLRYMGGIDNEKINKKINILPSSGSLTIKDELIYMRRASTGTIQGIGVSAPTIFTTSIFLPDIQPDNTITYGISILMNLVNMELLFTPGQPVGNYIYVDFTVIATDGTSSMEFPIRYVNTGW